MIRPAREVPSRLLHFDSHEGPDYAVAMPRDEGPAAVLAFGALSKLVIMMIRSQRDAPRLSVPRAVVIASDLSDGSFGRFAGTSVTEGRVVYTALEIALSKAVEHDYTHVAAAAYWGQANKPGEVLHPLQEDAASFTVDSCAGMFFIAADERLQNAQLLARRALTDYAESGVWPNAGRFSIEPDIPISQHQNLLLHEMGGQLAGLYPDYAAAAHFKAAS